MFGCMFGHDSYVISTETLIQTPYYGFIFRRCRRCNKCKIDSTSFKGSKKGTWEEKWTDNHGIMPQCSLPDKYCPKCNKKMAKSTAFGGEWTCQSPLNQFANLGDDYHFETIKAKPEDYIEV